MQVSEHVSEAMLGIEWLSDLGANWDFENGVITLEGNAFPLKMRPFGGRVCRTRVKLADDVAASPGGVIGDGLTGIWCAFRTKRLKANSRRKKPGLGGNRVISATEMVDAGTPASDPVSPADAPDSPVAKRKRGRWRPRPVIDDDSEEEEVVRPKRQAGRPRRFDDFV